MGFFTKSNISDDFGERVPVEKVVAVYVCLYVCIEVVHLGLCTEVCATMRSSNFSRVALTSR